MKKYTFPPMLGPASAQLDGSAKWAECFGNELEYHVERAVDRAIDDVLICLRKIIANKVWEVENPVGRTLEEFVENTTGYTYFQLWVLIRTFVPKHGLPTPPPARIGLNNPLDQAIALRCYRTADAAR